MLILSFQFLEVSQLLQSKLCQFVNLPSKAINIPMLRQGNIVLAPLKEALWPAKILSLAKMVQVKLYEMDSILTVQPQSLVQYTSFNTRVLLDRIKGQKFACAVKLAEKDYADWLKHQDQMRSKTRATQYIKNNEAIKKEQQQEKVIQSEQSEEQLYFTQYLLQLDELQLIAQAKHNTPIKVSFFNFYSKQVETYLEQPRLLLVTLVEQLMKSLLTQNHSSVSLSYEARLRTILSSWDASISAIINSNILKLANLSINSQKERFPWLTKSYITTLQKFKQEMMRKLQISQDHYSEMLCLRNQASDFWTKRSFRNK